MTDVRVFVIVCDFVSVRSDTVMTGTASVAHHVATARRCTELIRAREFVSVPLTLTHLYFVCVNLRAIACVCASDGRAAEGKAAYTVSVGKITLEKLLNFSANAVTVFVLIGCPFATLQLAGALGRASAVAALLTPHELHMATLPDRWWVPRFDWRLLYEHTVAGDGHEESDEEEEDVHHSVRARAYTCVCECLFVLTHAQQLLTGTLVARRPPTGAAAASTALVPAAGAQLALSLAATVRRARGRFAMCADRSVCAAHAAAGRVAGCRPQR